MFPALVAFVWIGGTVSNGLIARAKGQRDKACMEYQAGGGETKTVVERGAGTGTIVLAVIGSLALIGLLMPR